MWLSSLDSYLVMNTLTLGHFKNIFPIGLGMGVPGAYPDSKLFFKKLKNVLDYAVDSGVNFFDTAPVYGNGISEEIFKTINPNIRSKLCIASKVSPDNLEKKSFIKSVEESLVRAGLDYIDLIQIHWPNKNTPIEDTLEAVQYLIDSRKVLRFGVCNFSKKEINELTNYAGMDMLSSAQSVFNCFDLNASKEVHSFCKHNEKLFIAYSPLAQGYLVNGEKQKMILNDYALKYKASSSQIILRFLLDFTNTLVIPSTSKKVRLDDYINSVNIDISKKDFQEMHQMLIPKIQNIDTKMIQVTDKYNRKTYNTLIEAVENKLNMCPSPIDMSKALLEESEMLPVRVKKVKKNQFDLVEGRLRYWAWVLAYGWEKSIPVIIHED